MLGLKNAVELSFPDVVVADAELFVAFVNSFLVFVIVVVVVVVVGGGGSGGSVVAG